VRLTVHRPEDHRGWLPDGSTTEARSPVGAAAVRAILNGASVSEGYAQQGVTLPPPQAPGDRSGAADN
jgi:hypothetical protein